MKENPKERSELMVCEYCGCYTIRKTPNQKYCDIDEKPCKYYATLERQAKWKRENVPPKKALGSSNLDGKPNEDFMREHEIIQRERRRLGV